MQGRQAPLVILTSAALRLRDLADATSGNSHEAIADARRRIVVCGVDAIDVASARLRGVLADLPAAPHALLVGVLNQLEEARMLSRASHAAVSTLRRTSRVRK